LAAIRVIICVPQEHAARRVGMIEARRLGRLGVRQDVVAADRLIAAVQDVALPLAHEHAFGRSALISRICVDRTAALCRPAHDFDATVFRVRYQAPVGQERLGCGADYRDWHTPQAGR